ncbi:unnamed protein product, partial [Prorocentrum cordatum]
APGARQRARAGALGHAPRGGRGGSPPRRGPGRAGSALGRGMAACPPCLACLGGLRVRRRRRAETSASDTREDSAPDITVFQTVQRRVSSRRRAPGIDLGILRLNYDPSRPVNKQYRTLEKLGEGAYGSVYKVKNEVGDQIRAMKVLNKKTDVKEDMGFVVAEIEAMVRLDHPNIARCIQFFEDDRSIYLIAELCNGGDFSKVGRFGRQEVRLLFQDVFRGVAYCHGQDIAHRDLKFENCMLCTGQGRRVAKVIDFGHSSIKTDGSSDLYMNEALGTKYFVAPEVIDNQVQVKMYGVKCDIWSLGVMMYIILTKEHPFAEHATKLPSRELFRKIRGGSLRLRPLDQAHVEVPAVELLKGQPGLLTRSVPLRIDAASALKKEWLNVDPDPSRSLVSQTSEAEMLSRLVTYRNMSRFEKTVLMMAAHQADIQVVE